MTLNEMVALAGKDNLDKEVMLRTVGEEICSIDEVLDSSDVEIIFCEGECP